MENSATSLIASLHHTYMYSEYFLRLDIAFAWRRQFPIFFSCSWMRKECETSSVLGMLKGRRVGCEKKAAGYKKKSRKEWNEIFSDVGREFSEIQENLFNGFFFEFLTNHFDFFNGLFKN